MHIFARIKKRYFALELKANLKAFFHYCIAHCSLSIPVAPTACKVTLLWTNSVYNVSLTVTTQQQLHLQQYALQTVLSDLKSPVCRHNITRTCTLQYRYNIHFTVRHHSSCTLTALYWKKKTAPHTHCMEETFPQLWSTTGGALQYISHCVVYKTIKTVFLFCRREAPSAPICLRLQQKS